MTDCPKCRNADGENAGPCPCPCHSSNIVPGEHNITYDSATDSWQCDYCLKQHDDLVHAKTCDHKKAER